MTNYVKTTDFAAKDALPTGNPNKIAQGTQVDVEYNNIATAIATKEDTANRAQANGYASLDGSGDVPDAQIPATIPRLASNNTFTGPAQGISGATPEWRMNNTAAASGSRAWSTFISGTTFQIGVYADGYAGGPNSFLAATRSGVGITSIDLAGTAINFNGVAHNNASIFTTGSLLAAVVPQGAVTQHQAALTITESQITNGTTLARLADNEVVSGAWSFAGNPTMGGFTNWHAGNDGNGSGLDADVVRGIAPSTAAVASTIVQREASGHVYAINFNTTSLNDSQPVVNVMFQTGDGFIRGGTLQNVADYLSDYTRNIVAKAGFAKTLSSSAPSGGSDGDIWYQY